MKALLAVEIDWISDEARETYELLISTAGSPTELDGYCERHHVVPRSFGGSDSESNLVYLTAPNHLLAHYWLWVGTGDRNMGHAYFAMANTNWRRYNETPVVTQPMMEAYELARIASAERLSELFTGREMSDEAKARMSKSQKGRPKSEEHRRSISQANKGKSKSEEHRRKLSEAKTGVKMSDEAKAKMSEAQKGKILSEETRKVLSENMSRLNKENNPSKLPHNRIASGKRMAELVAKINRENNPSKLPHNRAASAERGKKRWSGLDNPNNAPKNIEAARRRMLDLGEDHPMRKPENRAKKSEEMKALGNKNPLLSEENLERVRKLALDRNPLKAKPIIDLESGYRLRGAVDGLKELGIKASTLRVACNTNAEKLREGVPLVPSSRPKRMGQTNPNYGRCWVFLEDAIKHGLSYPDSEVD